MLDVSLIEVISETEINGGEGPFCKETLCLCLGYIVSVYCMHIV